MNITEHNKRQDVGLLLLRLAVGGLLILHGLAKLSHGHDFIKDMLVENGLPQFLWLGIPLTEVIAPLLLITGVFTRMAAAGVAVLMIMTILLAHLPNAFTLSETGGLEVELNLLYMFGALAIILIGPGRYAFYKPDNAWLK